MNGDVMGFNFNDLGDRGFSGTLNDRTHKVLELATGESGSIQDLWRKYFDELGIKEGSYNDRLRSYLIDYLGLEGTSLNDLLKEAADGNYSIPASMYFTTLVAASLMHYTIPSITLSGDFEIECKCVIPTLGGFLFAKNPSTSDRISIDSLGNFYITANSILASDVTNPLLSMLGDGQLHKIVIKRVSGTVELIVDDVLKSSVSNSEDLTINRIGSPW